MKCVQGLMLPAEFNSHGLKQCSFFSISVSKRPKERLSYCPLNVTGCSPEPGEETLLYVNIGIGAEPEEVEWKKKEVFLG